jgi:hypothetical protein
MASVVGMVVTIQTNVGPNEATSIVTEQNLEKIYLQYPEEKDRLACVVVKMLMLDGWDPFDPIFIYTQEQNPQGRSSFYIQ